MQQLNLFRSASDVARYEGLKPKFMQIKNLVDWEAFRHDLLKALAYKTNPLGQGRRPFDPVLMFRIAILQHFYDLSHDAMEFQLRDRQSFREFVGYTNTPRSLMPRPSGFFITNSRKPRFFKPYSTKF